MSKSPQALLDSAWSCLDQGDEAAAAELGGRILDLEPDEETRAEARLVLAHTSILGGNEAEARRLLAESVPSLPADAELLTDAANVALALRAGETAAELADRALAIDEAVADAAYARGLAAQALGDDETAVAMFLRTAELDAGDPDPPWAMTVDQFAEVAEDTLQRLPAVVIKHLENVPIIVEAAPTAELVRDGVDPRLLGLFSGVPLGEKSIIDEGAPALDAIHLFQRNLERNCADREELIAEIEITVIHETAHFFGLDDDDLDALGLG